MKKFDLIDFLKGFSIFAIMLFHYFKHLHLPAPFDKIIFFGGTGVHLFVLLSGFGLAYSYLNKPIGYSDFIKKRFTKIYIPYILVILLSALIPFFIPVFDNSIYAIGGHVFLYKMFDESIMGSYGYQLWFISLMLQFYLTFYIIIWLKSQLKNNWFLIFGILLSTSWAILVYLINKENERIWNSFFLQYFWEFALGMVIAERVFKNQRLIDKDINQSFLFIISIINCGIYAFLAIKGGSIGKLFNDVFALTGFSLLAIWLYNFNLKPINQLFLYIGKISLSVYLLHIVLLLTILSIFKENTLYAVILSLIIIIPISALYQNGISKFFKMIKI